MHSPQQKGRDKGVATGAGFQGAAPASLGDVATTWGSVCGLRAAKMGLLFQPAQLWLGGFRVCGCVACLLAPVVGGWCAATKLEPRALGRCVPMATSHVLQATWWHVVGGRVAWAWPGEGSC